MYIMYSILYIIHVYAAHELRTIGVHDSYYNGRMPAAVSRASTFTTDTLGDARTYIDNKSDRQITTCSLLQGGVGVSVGSREYRPEHIRYAESLLQLTNPTPAARKKHVYATKPHNATVSGGIMYEDVPRETHVKRLPGRNCR